ncbi:NOP5/NOP56 family protein [Tardisphaera saccharovorans]
MPSYLVVTPAGILVFGDDMEKRYARPLTEDEADAVFGSLSHGEIPELLSQALSAVPAGEELVVFSEDVLGALKGYKARIAAPEEFRNVLSEQVVSTALGLPVDKYREALTSFSAKQSRSVIKQESSRKDLLAAEGIRAIDDLDETLNVLSTRAREWYGVHFPELNSIVPDQRAYLKVVLAGIRPYLDEQSLSGIKSAKSIIKAADSSMGAQWDEEAWKPLRELAQGLLQLYDVREELDDYVERAMKEAAPNLTELVGAALGARLISLAGGLDRLARMPSSTIQVLGAEKALFRAMKTGARPPKHGVIFQYPAVHSAPKWLRGRLARAVASKIAIAARIDVFGEGRIDPAIKADLEAKVKQILSSPPRPRKEGRPFGRKHDKGRKRRK